MVNKRVANKGGIFYYGGSFRHLSTLQDNFEEVSEIVMCVIGAIKARLRESSSELLSLLAHRTIRHQACGNGSIARPIGLHTSLVYQNQV